VSESPFTRNLTEEQRRRKAEYGREWKARNREKLAAYQRARRERERLGIQPLCQYEGCTEQKTPGKGSRYCAQHREEAWERHEIQKQSYAYSDETKARRKARRAVKRAELALVKPPKPPKVVVRPVPREVQDAYRVAKPNSIIRQKYPTWEKLRANYWKEAA
jgi:hypothetical protein